MEKEENIVHKSHVIHEKAENSKCSIDKINYGRGKE